MPDSEALLQKLDSRIDSIDKKLADARTERKNSQILMSIFTALITSVVGFAAWLAQSRVQQHIDEKSKDLETILALKQEVYSRELDRYENVHEQMAALVNALSQVQADPTQKKTADDAIHNLYVTYTTDSLYLSNDVIGELKALVDASGNIPSLVSTSDATVNQPVESMQRLDAQVAIIEDQMKKDLSLTQLGQISARKSGTQP